MLRGSRDQVSHENGTFQMEYGTVTTEKKHICGAYIMDL